MVTKFRENRLKLHVVLPTKKQTNKRTDSRLWRKHILIGGVNNVLTLTIRHPLFLVFVGHERAVELCSRICRRLWA